MTSSPPARRSFDWRDLGVRLASASLLIPLALAGVWFGGWWFFLLMALIGSRLCVEWGRMTAPETGGRAAVLVKEETRRVPVEAPGVLQMVVISRCTAASSYCCMLPRSLRGSLAQGPLV